MLLVGISLLLAWPAIWYGWPQLGHDSMNHARWLDEFSGQIRSGEWYPRWLSDANGGLGSPTFFYYPPLAHYLAAPFVSLWAPGTSATWHALGLAGALVLIASAIAAYFWLARWTGNLGALWGALVYTVVPWHTAVDLYNRGAWAEFSGFLWMPLILLAADRLIGAGRGAVLLIAAFYALLVLTHVPTAELLSPVLLAYVLFFGSRGRRLRLVIQIACATLLGLGISAVYLLPAVLQQDAASVGILGAQGFYDYRKWFVGADIHSILDFKMRVLVVTASMLAAVAAGYYLSWHCARRPNRTRIVFWLAVSVACVFFMTPLSDWFWRTVRPLAAVSFPYRFNTILSLALAALSAEAAAKISRSSLRRGLLFAGAFGVFWLSATGWAASRAFLRWRPDPKGLEMLQDSERLKREPYEYLPRWALSTQHNGIEAPLAKLPGRGLRLESAAPDPAASASIVRWLPRRAILNVETAQPARLLVGQFYYPGWQARDLTNQRSLQLSPSPEDGLLLLDVPAGRRQILLTLEAQAPERIGSIISALSCSLGCILGLVSLARRRPAAPLRSPREGSNPDPTTARPPSHRVAFRS